MKPVKVGICGLGTVGGGTFNVLQRNAEEISRRAGRGIEVAQIATRTPKPQFQTTGIAITNDVFDVATNPEIDIVIDRKSTRLNSSHGYISYAVFCLKKKKK